jgi:hypothetical protein
MNKKIKVQVDRYMKKAEKFQAIQYDGTNAHEIVLCFGVAVLVSHPDLSLTFQEHALQQLVNVGDYVWREGGVINKRSPGSFNKTYELDSNDEAYYEVGEDK